MARHSYLAGVLAAFFLVMVTPAMAQEDVAPRTRAEWRAQVAARNGFRWTPWLAAGERVWKAVLRIEPKMKDVIGDGVNVDIAMSDLGFNGKEDFILSFYGPDACGVDGCLYVVLSQDGYTKLAYTARSFERSGAGINIDGRHISP